MNLFLSFCGFVLRATALLVAIILIAAVTQPWLSAEPAPPARCASHTCV